MDNMYSGWRKKVATTLFFTIGAPITVPVLLFLWAFTATVWVVRNAKGEEVTLKEIWREL